MLYKFKYANGIDRFIPVELIVDGPFSEKEVIFKLPVWRPGRYELGFFSKNIRHLKVTDQDGVLKTVEKLDHSSWKVSGVAASIRISYEYYAGELNGGSCWRDHDQLFINPIQCAMYVVGREHEACSVELDIPNDWEVASSLRVINGNTFAVDDYHELVDTPIIASGSLKHDDFIMDDITFHIWIQGECTPDMGRLKTDIKNYTRIQLDTMGSFPVNEFHYLIQVRPDKFYHGVEHTKSTVLVLGPGKDLMEPAMYENLIGVASHELFHVWNVKTIRPAEMLPYDLSKENYSKLGFVYEGVTTYYGDLFLARSGFFDLKGYLNQLNMRLQKHMNNYGRLNYSVLESSFDTWLDGYVLGIPGRKTSIYDEGCLLALCSDLLIRKHSANKRSLDDVMRVLNDEFAKNNIGYDLTSYFRLIEKMAGTQLMEFYDGYIASPVSYDQLINELLDDVGLCVKKRPSANVFERYLGVKVIHNGEGFRVAAIAEAGPAMQDGLLLNDLIVKIDHQNCKEILKADQLSSLEGKSVKLVIISNHKRREIEIFPADGMGYYPFYTIEDQDNVDSEQLSLREKWLTYQPKHIES